jgi:hypothetical protein
VWDPELPAVRPRFPDRVKAFVYGCAKAAAIIEGKMSNKRPPVAQPRRPRPLADKQIVLPPGVEDLRGQ